MKQKKLDPVSKVHPAIQGFDSLPDSAYVPIPVLCALYGISTATTWRRVRAGQIVAPYKIGDRSTRWSVGELRASLASIKGDKQ